MAVEGAGETDPSRAETQGVVGVPTLGAQEPSPQLYPCRLWWAAPLGRACTPPGRCQGLHNGAPGMGARPAHSARNNHSSAAVAGSLQGREDRRAADGPRVSDFQPGDGGGVVGNPGWVGEGLAPPHPPVAPPNLWSLKEGGMHAVGKVWGGEGSLSAHHHCHLEQGRGGEHRPQARTGLTGGAGGLLLVPGNPEKAILWASASELQKDRLIRAPGWLSRLSV